MKKKIIFMGTPDFASYILKGMLECELIQVVLVVTQPDRAFGRKKVLKQSEVKQVAITNKIEVFQPENIKLDFNKIIEKNCDLIITAAYGQIVPIEVLNAPKIRCINIHGSLLPKYRGGAPIHYAVINGDKKTGVTLINMVSKMDAGDMIAKKEVLIDINENTGNIFDKLKIAAKDLILEELPNILSENMNLVPQEEKYITFAPTISKELEYIRFQRPVFQVHNHIRGLVPFPVGYCIIKNLRIKLFKSEITDICSEKANTIYKFDETGLYINCTDYVINITEFQIAGKRKMSIKEYINGGLNYKKGENL